MSKSFIHYWDEHNGGGNNNPIQEYTGNFPIIVNNTNHQISFDDGNYVKLQYLNDNYYNRTSIDSKLRDYLTIENSAKLYEEVKKNNNLITGLNATVNDVKHQADANTAEIANVKQNVLENTNRIEVLENNGGGAGPNDPNLDRRVKDLEDYITDLKKIIQWDDDRTWIYSKINRNYIEISVNAYKAINNRLETLTSDEELDKIRWPHIIANETKLNGFFVNGKQVYARYVSGTLRGNDWITLASNVDTFIHNGVSIFSNKNWDRLNITSGTNGMVWSGDYFKYFFKVYQDNTNNIQAYLNLNTSETFTYRGIIWYTRIV